MERFRNRASMLECLILGAGGLAELCTACGTKSCVWSGFSRYQGIFLDEGRVREFGLPIIPYSRHMSDSVKRVREDLISLFSLALPPALV